MQIDNQRINQGAIKHKNKRYGSPLQPRKTWKKGLVCTTVESE